MLDNKIRLMVYTFALSFLLFSCANEKSKAGKEVPKPNPFNLAINDLIEVRDTIQADQTLSNILTPHGVSLRKIHEIEKKALNIFPLSKFRTDKELYIYAKWDSVETVKYLVYVQDKINYIVYDLRDSIMIYKKQRPFTIKQVIVSGTITDNLIKTLIDKNVDAEVGYQMADIYESRIDFEQLQTDDSFTVIYDQVYVDGKPTQLGKIYATKFNFKRKDYYAFRFDQEKEGTFFDELGNGLQGMFLTAPIKFRFRISSRYSQNRYHPILHRNKAHLGTDFAAAYGTPIQTVATGVVLEASRTGGNGNYVKIRHNESYATQYLHMSKFANGIKRGTHVIQGQTIGYVGSSGLAKGPHVCFRFWKNGKQVDPLREKNQSSGPVSKKNKKDFYDVRKMFMDKLKVAA
jgi:murein DD-endopeptidase MepM/ murein hydrolase activator NlpD